MIDPFDLQRAIVMLTGYDAMWAEEAAKYRVLGVEVEFVTDLISPHTGAPSNFHGLAGKIDALVEEIATGRVGTVEHKTTSQDAGPGSDYMKLLKLNPQISIYQVGGESILGRPIDFCLYDVLVKPGQRPLKVNKKRATDETPEEYRDRMAAAMAEDPTAYFLRAEVVRLDSEVQAALHDIWDMSERLLDDEEHLRFPRNPDACVRYGSTCEHFGVCCGEETHEDNERFERVRPHPELTEIDRDVLSASRLSALRACPRLHHFRYGQGWRAKKEADALSFGTLIHKGLEAWWRADGAAKLPAAMKAIGA